MKSNHLLLLALKKVREHVGEGTNTSRFLTSELGLLRSIQGIADVIHFIPMEGQPYRLTEGRVVFFVRGRFGCVSTFVKWNLRRAICWLYLRERYLSSFIYHLIWI